MTQEPGRSKKTAALSLLFGAFMFAFMIRAAISPAVPTLAKLYNIPDDKMGYLLSAWNWSYTGALLVSGQIVDRFGPWVSLGGGSLIWGLATLALPLGIGFASLFFLRVLFGVGQGVTVPSIATSVSRIFSPKERTTAIAIAFSGNNVGTAIAVPVSAYLLSHFGWQSIFYCIGAASLLLTVAWFVFFPEKRIGKRLAEAGLTGATSSPEPEISWGSLFRYRSTWGIAFGQMGYLYTYYFFVTWLPSYFIRDRQMTLLRTGIYASLPFWAGMIGTLFGGWLGDYLIRRGTTATVSRKSIIGFGLSGAAVLVVAAAFAEQALLAVALITLGVGCLRLATGSANSLAIDLAPRTVVGSLTAIQNFFGNVGGLLAPIVTGYLLQSTGNFLSSLIVAAGMALFGAVSYVFLVGNLERDRINPVPTGATLRASAPRTA